MGKPEKKMNREEDENMKVSDRGQGGWEEEVTQGRGERTKEGKGKKSGDVFVNPGRYYCYSESRARLKFQVFPHT